MQWVAAPTCRSELVICVPKRKTTGYRAREAVLNLGESTDQSSVMEVGWLDSPIDVASTMELPIRLHDYCGPLCRKKQKKGSSWEEGHERRRIHWSPKGRHLTSYASMVSVSRPLCVYGFTWARSLPGRAAFGGGRTCTDPIGAVSFSPN